MLEHISWPEFAVFITGGCVAYYGTLLISGKFKLKNSNERVLQTTTAAAEPHSEPLGYKDVANEVENSSDADFETLELLAEHLQIIITQNSVDHKDKDALFELLRKEIIQYPELNKPAFRGAITNLIIKTAQQELGLEVSKQEATDLWSMG